MAIQIVLEFTDAQWELIKGHLQLPDAESTSRFVITEEDLKKKLNFFIRQSVQQQIAETGIQNVVKEAETAFDV